VSWEKQIPYLEEHLWLASNMEYEEEVFLHDLLKPSKNQT
jgi:hypothetical protein